MEAEAATAEVALEIRSLPRGRQHGSGDSGLSLGDLPSPVIKARRAAQWDIGSGPLGAALAAELGAWGVRSGS